MQRFLDFIFHILWLRCSPKAVDTQWPTARRLKTTKVRQHIHIGIVIVGDGRIVNKAKGTCTICSTAKYKNVVIKVSVRNGGIGHVEQKRQYLNRGQFRCFPDEDHMTYYEDKTNNISAGVLGSTLCTKISRIIMAHIQHGLNLEK
jgi:hypothetical protein